MHHAKPSFIFCCLLFCSLIFAERTLAADQLLLRDRQQVMMLGNSLTEGEDPDGYVNMTRLLLKHVLPEMTVFVGNAGKGGNTCVDMRERLGRDVLRFHPDWVTVSAGINDINKGFTTDHPEGDAPQGITLDQYRTNMTAIVRQIKKQGGHVALFTPTVIKENLSSKENARLVGFRTVVHEIARTEKCLVVDMGAAFMATLQPLQKPGMPLSGVLTADGVHLLQAGSWLMAKTLVQAWGVPAERIEAVKEAVEKEVEQQKRILRQRLAKYAAANQEIGTPRSGEQRIVCIGSGLVEQWPLDQLSSYTVFNRGIDGENSRGLRMRFHQDAVALKPAAIVIWPGFCDDFQPDQRMSIIDTESHLARIARLAKGSGIQVAIGSILPGANVMNRQNHISSRDLRKLNKWLEKLCRENDYVYIDFYQKLVGKENRLKKECSPDGVHLETGAYEALQPMLMHAIEELTRRTQK